METFPNNKTARSNEGLPNATIDYCEKRGYSYVVGSVFTTSAMLLETKETNSDGAFKGHVGVDMETVTTLAVAKKFDKKSNLSAC
ncbi:hypothetical protein BGM26_14050 [Bacillus sp. FJAT-29790]|uniref:hypothetical protein n=1 Tax=Bacillus sp. FJAT-29790 TaxID=1895002 RepID=UPI001C235BA5|nr:hypothetical protein [Bacillus sp. FJAT-29790]MBU8880101.1 hypothetical protein [Bacillus sp. FJAT-29790]